MLAIRPVIATSLASPNAPSVVSQRCALIAETVPDLLPVRGVDLRRLPRLVPPGVGERIHRPRPPIDSSATVRSARAVRAPRLWRRHSPSAGRVGGRESSSDRSKPTSPELSMNASSARARAVDELGKQPGERCGRHWCLHDVIRFESESTGAQASTEYSGGMTIGLIGAGHIGSQVARLAVATRLRRRAQQLARARDAGRARRGARAEGARGDGRGGGEGRRHRRRHDPAQGLPGRSRSSRSRARS